MIVKFKRMIKSYLYQTRSLQKLAFGCLNLQADTAKKKILNKKKKKVRSAIKVGFIVQMPEVWDKIAPVYEKMVKDKRFAAWLIIVPKYDFVQKTEGDYGEECEYFLKKYPDCNYIIYDKLGRISA